MQVLQALTKLASASPAGYGGELCTVMAGITPPAPLWRSRSQVIIKVFTQVIIKTYMLMCTGQMSRCYA